MSRLADGAPATPTGGWLDEALHIVSPNRDPRPPGEVVSLIVIHAISLPPARFGGDGIVRLFTNRLDPAAHPYFAQIIGELLYWIGEDKILFASDYALWTPKWLVERFVDFQIPDDMTEYAPITTDQKKKILGLNAAALYPHIQVPEELRLPDYPPAVEVPDAAGTEREPVHA